MVVAYTYCSWHRTMVWVHCLLAEAEEAGRQLPINCTERRAPIRAGPDQWSTHRYSLKALLLDPTDALKHTIGGDFCPHPIRQSLNINIHKPLCLSVIT